MNISLLRLTGKMNHTIYQRFLNLWRALWATTYLASRVDSSDLLLLYLFLEVDLPENHLGERSFLLKYYYYYYYYYYHTQLGAGDRFAIRILLGQEWRNYIIFTTKSTSLPKRVDHSRALSCSSLSMGWSAKFVCFKVYRQTMCKHT